MQKNQLTKTCYVTNLILKTISSTKMLQDSTIPLKQRGKNRQIKMAGHLIASLCYQVSST